MKKVLRLILITIFISTTFFLHIGMSQEQEGEDTVIGDIIEIVPDEKIIQVGNRNYIVKMVYLDDGSVGEPLLGRFGNLDLGSTVEIYIGEKNEGFWEAKKVILFLGEKKEEILKLIEE